MAKRTKKHAKHAEFLLAELNALNFMTVNDMTDETLQRAAPDTFYTIHQYLIRRLREVDAKNGQ